MNKIPTALKPALRRGRDLARWWYVASSPRQLVQTLGYRMRLYRYSGKEYAGIHLGSGGIFIPGFLNVDGDFGVPCDVVGSVQRLYLRDNSVDVIYASHLFEHISRRDASSTLLEWRRVLRPGGKLFLCIPDLEVLSRIYLESLGTDGRPSSKTALAAGIMYGGQVDNYDYHYFGYSFMTISELLEDTGFEQIERFDRSNLSFANFHDGGFAHIDGEPVSLNVVATG